MTQKTKEVSIIQNHATKSREVETKDLPRVLEDAIAIYELIKRGGFGKYQTAYAIAHCQVTDKDPLRFFVTNEGEVIINPKILNKTKHQVLSHEGCLTFTNEEDEMVYVKRSRKVTVEFQRINLPDHDTIEGAFLSQPEVKEFNNTEAFIFQHEIDHMDGCTIYDKD